MPATREELFSKLDELGIVHETYDHAPVFTVEESAEIKSKMPGGHSKNLFLKDKAGDFFLICAQSDTCLLYTSPSPRDGLLSRMPSSA